MCGKLHSQFSRIKDLMNQNNQIFVMREDLLPSALGGNKVRIAEEFLEDMKKRNCDTMIAYGKMQSNLCRVLALRCFEEKIPCYIICSGDESETCGERNANSQIIQMLHVKMVYCTTDRIAETVEKTIQQIENTGHKPYYIYGNKFGTGNEGVPAGAYAKAYCEIKEFEKEKNLTFDYIFHASGTGATQAGLICGHLFKKDKAQIMGVLISSRTYERAVSIIENGVRDYLERQNIEYREEFSKEIKLLSEYTKGGYGMYDEEILSCIRKQLQENSLMLDPVYTGKAFWGMEQYLLEQKITDKNILFIHTGGIPLFYDCLMRGELQ